MKFTLNWLKEHLDFNDSLEVILNALTTLGIEVEHVENYVEKLQPFSIAYIQKTKPHPNADKLKICQVLTNEGELQIVCGAPNAREGIYVVYAPVGSKIPATNLVLKATEIRGIASNGMMLSEKELQISEEHDGIIELKAKVGQSAVSALGLDDIVIDITLTPNRGDLLGVRGIAKDLQAYGIGKLKAIKLTELKTTAKTEISFQLNHGLSEKFVIQKIVGISNQPSPQWLQNRLKLIGKEPRNALVDITNYICIDLNQPLHCYDLDKIANPSLLKLDLSTSADFVALDDNSYKLNPLIPIISFAENVACMAGIKGAKQTAVDINTKNILLEAAHFDSKTIALAVRDLAITTEASYRYERGIDIANLEVALHQATTLIAEICGGTFFMPTKVETTLAKKPIIVDISYIQQLTGLKLEARLIQKILESLACEVSYKNHQFTVLPPSYRNDIDDPSVIVSEIIRLQGLDSVPQIEIAKSDNKYLFMPLFTKTMYARRAAANLGLLESINMSFISNDLALDFNIFKHELLIDNPISNELSMMRNSLLPSLMQTAKYNINNSYINQRIFEVANIYHSSTEYEMSLAFLLSGNSCNKNWQHDAKAYNVWDSKALILRMIEDLGLKTANLALSQTDLPSYYHPAKSAKLLMGKIVIAYFGELHPAILEKQAITQPLLVGEFFIERLPTSKNKIAKNQIILPNIMPVMRDFAFIVAKNVKASTMIKLVKSVDKKLITEVNIFDVYEHDKLGAEQKSVALKVVLQAQQQTLTESELNILSEKIIATLEQSLNAVLR